MDWVTKTIGADCLTLLETRIKVTLGLAPSEGCKGRISFADVLGPSPWLAGGWFLRVSLHILSLLCQSLCSNFPHPRFFFLEGHPSYGMRAHSNDLVLT